MKVLADGRVYTGRQAVAEKLIDDLGGEEKAVDWLQTQKKLPSGHRDCRLAQSLEIPAPPAWAFPMANTVLKVLGFEGLTKAGRKREA